MSREKQKELTIALDLEGTLISNAVSQFPRIYIQNISRSGGCSAWFVDLEYINWHGTYKDLSFIPQATIDSFGTLRELTILIDDQIEYIHPDQKYRWLEIHGYEYPYPDDDLKLERVMETLSQIYWFNTCAC